jgi:hypothetical protein
VNANITAGGIQYNNLFYECDPDIASGARVFGRTTCEARIDDNCVDYIYVRFDKNSIFKSITCLRKRDIFKGKAHLDTDVMADWVDTQKELIYLLWIHSAISIIKMILTRKVTKD